jgi:two-component sensor histidine kinase
MDQLSDAKAIGLFKESQNRVRSIALFHEKLYQSRDLGRVEIAEYLKGLAHDSFATYGVNPDDIVLAVHTEDIPLGVDAAISCGLIVNELVSNSLKHAFPDRRKGRVEVSLHAAGTDVVLEVADNGVGFPANLDFHGASTLGLKLVAIFTEQVGGTIDLEREGGWTVFHLSPPASYRISKNDTHEAKLLHHLIGPVALFGKKVDQESAEKRASNLEGDHEPGLNTLYLSKTLFVNPVAGDLFPATKAVRFPSPDSFHEHRHEQYCCHCLPAKFHHQNSKAMYLSILYFH